MVTLWFKVIDILSIKPNWKASAFLDLTFVKSSFALVATWHWVVLLFLCPSKA